ncbi:hypothetical protein SAMN05421866_2716 [Chryseobacterium oranimense]|uniref:Uncharacterized protein n=1 Tax=Chryseobacterium oranimense TaxID=421058 RepID=A0A1M5SCG8_9FLAO|nr:hypothetical protein [Chryseobacterium oranimense]SHH36224.1 hypothetical protein SAMN05421866_2716 [Chryseobacterium oranimense]
MSLIITYIDSDYEYLINNKDFTIVNFPIKSAIKIYDNYGNLKGKNQLKLEIENIIGFKDDHLNSGEAIESFIVYTFYLLKTHKNLVIFTAGLSFSSIKHYIKIMDFILSKLSDRTLCVVKNFSIIDEIKLIDLYIHVNKVEKEIIFDFMKNSLIGFKPKEEYFRYPQYFGEIEFETDDYFEMLSFVLARPNRDYEFYFTNKNNLQNPKGMILINNNSIYLGLGVAKGHEKYLKDKLAAEYMQAPIICDNVLPY